MIFVVCGTQEPFDRLLEIVDQWLDGFEEKPEVFAQSGDSSYSARNFQLIPFLSPQDFQDRFNQAECIIAHAGMGTILSALQSEKPIIVFPRREEYGEHRDNHQVDTVESFNKLDFIHAAFDKEELLELLRDYDSLAIKKTIGAHAQKSLLDAVKEQIVHSGRGKRKIEPKKKVLAVCSGGGHFVQMRRLAPAFNGHELVFCSVNKGYGTLIDADKTYEVHDANKKRPVKAFFQALRIIGILLRERPDIVVSTGASIGAFSCMFSFLSASKVLWVDSIANSSRLSLSGKIVSRLKGTTLTQWSALGTERIGFKGTVLG
jgi:UDP-N-acetylglucosamine transferase subunit ALG13